MMRLAFLACVAALALVAPARAQDVSDDPPAHISVVDGAVVLERDGRSQTAPASMPLLAGDRLRTQDGRAEVLFADGSTLHLDTGTIVDFQSDDVIRLLDGRVRELGMDVSSSGELASAYENALSRLQPRTAERSA